MVFFINSILMQKILEPISLLSSFNLLAFQFSSVENDSLGWTLITCQCYRGEFAPLHHVGYLFQLRGDVLKKVKRDQEVLPYGGSVLMTVLCYYVRQQGSVSGSVWCSGLVQGCSSY